MNREVIWRMDGTLRHRYTAQDGAFTKLYLGNEKPPFSEGFWLGSKLYGEDGEQVEVLVMKRAEMNGEAHWQKYKKAILERAAGDERKLLELMCEGFAPELANVSDVQYAKELVAAWNEILEVFGGDES